MKNRAETHQTKPTTNINHLGIKSATNYHYKQLEHSKTINKKPI